LPTLDPRIDEYIERSGDFAQPVLIHLRSLIHKACPDIKETLKWSMPSFEHKGIVCGFAAFKKHCKFMFWKQELLDSDAFPANRKAMDSFARITSPTDLPSDEVVIGLIQQAVELNEKGIKSESKSAAPKTELVVPEDLENALAKNKIAKMHFDAFTYSKKKDYVDWITGAKTEATRNKRLTTTIEWVAEGKGRNWKYER
jgi:Uncharacterized protein conserved in bacteria